MCKFSFRILIALALMGLVYGCGDISTLDDSVLSGTFTINNGDDIAQSAGVTLNFDVAEADWMRFRNQSGEWSEWEAIAESQTTKGWTLVGADGSLTVFAEFEASDGRDLALDDSIVLDTVRTRVLIIDDDEPDFGFQTILADDGYTVTMGGAHFDYTGTDFSAYDLVIMLFCNEYHYDMDTDMMLALKDWINGGGVLLTTEWLLYSQYAPYGNFDTLLDILPLIYDDDYDYDQEIYTRMVDHPITANLPADFTTPPDWSFSYTIVNGSSQATDIQVLFEGSISGDALAIGTVGSGYTIHWNMAGNYNGNDIWSTETELILTNIAAFAD